MKGVVKCVSLLLVGLTTTHTIGVSASMTAQELATVPLMMSCRGGGIFPGDRAKGKGAPQGKAKKTSPQRSPPTKGLKKVGQARMGVSSGNRGLWMNMDLDVRKLTDSLGEVRRR